MNLGSIVIALGDSITSGYAGALSSALGSSYTTLNYGVGGQNSTSIKARWETYRTMYDVASVAILAGYHDVNSGATSSAVLANLTAMYDEAIADGTQVVPCTLTPVAGVAGWTVAKTTVLEEVNTGIRDYCTLHSITCVDLHASALNDGAGNLAAIYDSGDHLHPNAAGQTLIANAVKAVISP